MDKMPIFLDTGDTQEIARFMRMGLVRGVTTNPTILAKSGIKGGIAAIKKRAIEIAGLVCPYPVSVELIHNDPSQMIDQAREFSQWGTNINVKVPIHGPHGELDNLEVIHTLEAKYGIPINVTAMMSAQQGFLAALAGATFVSLFGGRINNMGYNCTDEIQKLRRLLNEHGLKARIIVGSTREILNVIEWLSAGAHIVTVTPALLNGMLVHPYSKETVQMFLKDAESI